jgi:hypothetical protein
LGRRLVGRSVFGVKTMPIWGSSNVTGPTGITPCRPGIVTRFERTVTGGRKNVPAVTSHLDNGRPFRCSV